jgi:hypothetical protein
MRLGLREYVCTAAVVLLAGGVAAGQAVPGGSSAGPLVLTPIPSQIVFSPEVKATRINHTTARGFLHRSTD